MNRYCSVFQIATLFNFTKKVIIIKSQMQKMILHTKLHLVQD